MPAYKKIIRPVLFRFDAESMHNGSITLCEKLGNSKIINRFAESVFSYKNPKLETSIGKLHFENPIGLAAGYDKSGHAVSFLQSLGFGHVEIGSVSAFPSDGNPKPRLFRLPADKALVVHYGLQNDGAEVVAKRLANLSFKKPLGINIVKTNRGINAAPDTEDEILDDYRKSTLLLQPAADYLTYNLSCPNTEMGRDYFSDKKHINRFLQMLAEIKINCPVFLKISPLGGIENIEKYLEVCDSYDFISGFIFNLPPGKNVKLASPKSVWEKMPGAVSGKPVENIMNYNLSEMYKRMNKNRYRLISAGGVFSANNAFKKILLGASLVQLLTGMVYEGPGLMKKINKGLVAILENKGIKSVREAIGCAL